MKWYKYICILLVFIYGFQVTGVYVCEAASVSQKNTCLAPQSLYPSSPVVTPSQKVKDFIKDNFRSILMAAPVTGFFMVLVWAYTNTTFAYSFISVSFAAFAISGYLMAMIFQKRMALSVYPLIMFAGRSVLPVLLPLISVVSALALFSSLHVGVRHWGHIMTRTVIVNSYEAIFDSGDDPVLMFSEMDRIEAGTQSGLETIKIPVEDKNHQRIGFFFMTKIPVDQFEITVNSQEENRVFFSSDNTYPGSRVYLHRGEKTRLVQAAFNGSYDSASLRLTPDDILPRIINGKKVRPLNRDYRNFIHYGTGVTAGYGNAFLYIDSSGRLGISWAEKLSEMTSEEIQNIRVGFQAGPMLIENSKVLYPEKLESYKANQSALSVTDNSVIHSSFYSTTTLGKLNIDGIKMSEFAQMIVDTGQREGEDIRFTVSMDWAACAWSYNRSQGDVKYETTGTNSISSPEILVIARDEKLPENIPPAIDESLPEVPPAVPFPSDSA